MSETWTAERLAEVLPAEVVAMVPGLRYIVAPGVTDENGWTWCGAWVGSLGLLAPDEAAALMTAALLRALARSGPHVHPAIDPKGGGWRVTFGCRGDVLEVVKPTLLEALLAAYAATGHPARDGGAGE